MKAESAYNAVNGYLTTVNHNATTATSGDVIYTFGYDTLGRHMTVSIGTRTNVNVLSTTDCNVLIKQVSEISINNLIIEAISVVDSDKASSKYKE